MITYIKGNIFESPAKVLVNTVNTVGVMGKGIAKTFKQLYPDMFLKYQSLCEKNQFKVGQLWIYKTPSKWILNFPTKQTWRQPSKSEYIEAGLKKFSESFSLQGITSIAFPQLGCGNGELDWETTVHPLMRKYLAPLPIDIFIYEYPKGIALPEHKDIDLMQGWLHGDPKSLSFEEMWKDLAASVEINPSLHSWKTNIDFRVELAQPETPGLCLKFGSKSIWEKICSSLSKFISPTKPRPIGDRDIFVPKEGLLDLWQSTRAYGFCTSQTMPPGLDVIAPYIISLLSRFDYMKPIEMATVREGVKISEYGLQLISKPEKPAQSSPLPFEMHAVNH